MARVDPLPRDELSASDDRLAMVEQAMGFVPNSMPTMARVPGLLDALSGLGATVLMNDLIDPGLAQMVAYVSSTAGGCRYCQAHTAHSAERRGVPEDKLRELWLYETSEHFTDAERVALRIAQGAGSTPNAVTDEMFVAAREHYTDDQLAAIVAVTALFGYLNRWNDTMATELESKPAEFADRVLTDTGWAAGKHAD